MLTEAHGYVGAVSTERGSVGSALLASGLQRRVLVGADGTSLAAVVGDFEVKPCCAVLWKKSVLVQLDSPNNVILFHSQWRKKSGKWFFFKKR